MSTEQFQPPTPPTENEIEFEAWWHGNMHDSWWLRSPARESLYAEVKAACKEAFDAGQLSRNDEVWQRGYDEGVGVGRTEAEREHEEDS